MRQGVRKASDGRFSIVKQVKAAPLYGDGTSHRTAEPTEFARFQEKNAVSKDVKKSSLPGRFFSLRVGFAVCIPLF